MIKRILGAFILLSFSPAFAVVDQQGYLDCKEEAFKNLSTRYKLYFPAETNTNASTASQTAAQYESDYEHDGKGACAKKYRTGSQEDRSEENYQKCLDDALNKGATRFATYFPTNTGIANDAHALERVAQYQKDYTAADVKCRSQFLGEGDACVEQSKAAVQACGNAKETAVRACDPTQDSGLNAVKNASDNISKSGGAGGAQNSCTAQKQTAGDANTALSNYQASCSNAKQSCVSQCSQAQEAMKACSQASSGNPQASSDFQSTATNGDTCSVLEAKVQQAQQAIHQYTSTENQANNCKDATSGTGKPTGSGGGGGSGGGQAAAASTNSGESQKTLASNSNEGVVHSGGMAGLASGGGTAQAASVASGNGFGGKESMTLPSQSRSGRSSSSIGGKQGGSVNFGSSGLDGAYGAASAARVSKAENAGVGMVNTGAGGGYSGGGGGFGSRSMASEDEGRGNRHGMAMKRGEKEAPDLRQFLPGGARDPRGLAGLSGLDGITGPHSNIWKKVQNRYKIMTGTLLP